MKEQKFKPGDQVRIIGYGHIYWTTKEVWRIEEQFRVDYENRIWFNGRPVIKPRDKPIGILREDGDNRWIVDMSPEIVGKIGTVVGSYADFIESGDPRFAGGKRDEHNQSTYHVDGIPGKTAWYDEQQLELVK